MSADKTIADATSPVGELARLVEAVSARYAQVHSIERTAEWHVLKLNEEVGELTQAFLSKTGQARDKGRQAHEIVDDFASEVADVFAQLLVLAHHFDVDVVDELEKKWLVWHPDRHRPSQ